MRVTRSDISFFESNQYAMLYLKQDKTNNDHITIQIIFVVNRKKTYLIAALACFYTLNPQPANFLLFSLSSGIFSCFSVIIVLKK